MELEVFHKYQHCFPEEPIKIGAHKKPFIVIRLPRNLLFENRIGTSNYMGQYYSYLSWQAVTLP